MSQEERYRQVQMDRFNRNGSGVQDFSGPLAPGVGRDAIDAAVKKGAIDPQNNAIKGAAAPAGSPATSALSSPGATQAAQAAGEGDTMSAVGGGLMAAGTATANPYLMAAGLGVQVLASGEQNKRKEEEAQRQAYNEKIAARQSAMAKIASIGIQ